ncbi:MAG: branched-chain amino acid ABC transporter permease [Actinomycetes bacterium]
MSILWLSLGFGLVTASILALSSVGLSLQFGVTNYINFAYGAFLSLGMLLTWTLTRPLHLPFWLGAALTIPICGLVAVVVDRVVLEPFVRRGGNLLYLLIVTFGLSLILDNIMQAAWGVGFFRFAVGQGADLHLGPFQFTVAQLVIIGVAAAVMVGVHLLLTRTRLGKAMRAMSDNPALARVSGIDTKRVTMSTWFLSGCLAGAAGIALALNIVSFQTTSGDDLLFVVFAAVILGGIGQTYGAMLGALVIGVVTEVSAVYVGSAYKSDVAFLILVVVLLVRPQGLIPALGKA